MENDCSRHPKGTKSSCGGHLSLGIQHTSDKFIDFRKYMISANPSDLGFPADNLSFVLARPPLWGVSAGMRLLQHAGQRHAVRHTDRRSVDHRPPCALCSSCSVREFALTASSMARDDVGASLVTPTSTPDRHGTARAFHASMWNDYGVRWGPERGSHGGKWGA